MNYIDYFILFIVVLAAIQGFARGFIVEFFSLLAFATGILIAAKYSMPLAYWLAGDSKWLGIIKVAVFILLFVGLSYMLNTLARILKKMISLVFLTWLDKGFGVIVSITKWAFMLSMIIWILSTSGVNMLRGDFAKSLLFTHVAHFAPRVVGFFGNVLPFLKDIFDSNQQFGNDEQFAFLTNSISQAWI